MDSRQIASKMSRMGLNPADMMPRSNANASPSASRSAGISYAAFLGPNDLAWLSLSGALSLTYKDRVRLSPLGLTHKLPCTRLVFYAIAHGLGMPPSPAMS